MPDIKQTWITSGGFWKIIKHEIPRKLHKGSAVVPRGQADWRTGGQADWRTGGLADITCAITAFCSFAKGPKHRMWLRRASHISVHTGMLISPYPDPTENNNWKVAIFRPDAEVIAAVETWLDGQPSEFFFFLSGLQKLEFGRCSLFPSWSG